MVPARQADDSPTRRAGASLWQRPLCTCGAAGRRMVTPMRPESIGQRTIRRTAPNVRWIQGRGAMPELVRPREPRTAESIPEQLTPDLLGQVAKGDEAAFGKVYDLISARVFGLVRRVLRDEAQSEEVFQEVMLEVWRKASRFDAALGSPSAWIMTIAHRRAVDRVRSAQAAVDRDAQSAQLHINTAFDDTSEQVASRLEQRQVRRCLGTLTQLQRESIALAYYQGYTYPEVASLLGIALGTVKTRMRDGLIRLRDCMGVTA